MVYKNLYEKGFRPWEIGKITLPEYDLIMQDTEGKAPSGHQTMTRHGIKAKLAHWRALTWQQKLQNYERNY